MNEQKRNAIIIGIVVSVVLIGLVIFLTILWRDGKFTGGYTRSSTTETANLKISADDISKYTDYSTKNLDSRITGDYVSDIKSLLSSNEFGKIYSKINIEYKEENNLSEYNVEEFLKKNGYVGEKIWLDKITFYQESNTYVYRLKLIINYEVKYVDIIEESPYNYTIDFRQNNIPVINKKNYNITVDNINFEIKLKDKRENGIVYEVKVTNKSDKQVQFNFTSINNVGLKVEGGDIIKQPTAILENVENYSINKDSYFIKEFYFAINMQYHKDIVGLNFYNVKIGNKEMNIYLNF